MSSDSSTTIAKIPALVQKLRGNYERINSQPRSYEWRVSQLNALKKLLRENTKEFQDAWYVDMKQSPLMRWAEIEMAVQEIEHALKNLKSWMADIDIPNRALVEIPGTPKIVKEPYGVVLVIGTWNYPVHTLLKPVIGAIAAGNCTVIKPSEVSPNVSAVFGKTIPKYMDNDHIALVEGGPEVSQALLKQKFDYIFFTGSPAIGRHILAAAAPNLTPVTLELGGKSPCVVDDSANIAKTAERIAWAKFLNVGQTCTAPDYVLCMKSKQQELVDALKKVIKRFYGDDAQKSKDYSRIINTRHTQRVLGLLEEVQDKVVCGGTYDVEDKYIAPTIVVNPPAESRIMNEEIFGPVLPIVTIDSIDEAINRIKSKPRPLALYLFADNKAVVSKIMNNTNTGGVCVNACIHHSTMKTVPFGGIGESGMGCANGKFSFDTFTHNKGVLYKPNYDLSGALYPPYNDKNLGMLGKVARIHLPDLSAIKKVFTIGLYTAIVAVATLYATEKYGIKLPWK